MAGAGAGPGCWLLCWGWLLAAGHLRGAEAGCGRRGSPRCCPGRNNACADLSGPRGPCYCDTHCERTGDCCEDYPGVCQRADKSPPILTRERTALRCTKAMPADESGVLCLDHVGVTRCSNGKQRRCCSEASCYCVYFRLKQVGAACRLHLWSSQLMRERRVCVECRPDAVGSGARCKGDGLEGARTFWTATSIAGCQGSWIQESLHENCVCPLLSLIFV